MLVLKVVSPSVTLGGRVPARHVAPKLLRMS